MIAVTESVTVCLRQHTISYMCVVCGQADLTCPDRMCMGIGEFHIDNARGLSGCGWSTLSMSMSWVCGRNNTQDGYVIGDYGFAC